MEYSTTTVPTGLRGTCVRGVLHRDGLAEDLTTAQLARLNDLMRSLPETDKVVRSGFTTSSGSRNR